MTTPTQKKIYQKRPEDISFLINKLQERGLIIKDYKVAENALTFIGYYRLRGYFYPFYIMDDQRIPQPIEPKNFVAGTTLEDVIQLYEFDRKLRLIILEQIQKVEIGLRTCLSEHMSGKYGAHWFMNLSVLSNDYHYENFFGQINEAKETFIEHYKKKYHTPKYPPSWMITETLSFGSWSKMYKSLLPVDQKAIAHKFNVKNYEVMASWFHTLSHIRNLCAHHNRIWNRSFRAFPPKKGSELAQHIINPSTLYSRLAVLKYLSDQVSYNDGLKTQLTELMKDKPCCVKWEKMGFIDNWAGTPLWQQEIISPSA
ncbi:Abi family protein [Xenorhabdus sp. BG5]|uniref:Abi family protein n=1 Tax=Xenorhabdus sp. BG5 TaxID=2782014 RepID=UPI00187EE848|nr:Abi family protein [Xenorhabdus sp. BG5]MBE8597612.1 Abi family protein [Xenorhabdus sp. BG5]